MRILLRLTLTPTPSPKGIATTGVNLRAGPGTNFDKVGGLKEGDTVEILGKTSIGEWYQAKLSLGEVAWIAAAYVSTQSDINAIPTVQSGYSRQEVLALVREILSDTYNIIGVDDTTTDDGKHALFVSIQGPQSDAKTSLALITVAVSPLAPMANPPFDAAIVVIYSSQDEVILGAAVRRQEIDDWPSGKISAEEFPDKWVFITP